MDEKDAKILEMLRANSRIKNTDIARSIGLTEGAIRARIANLMRTGAIKKFTIETSTVGVEGLVLVRSEAGRSKDILSKLREYSDIVFETSGEFDAAITIKANDVDQLNSIVDRIRDIHGIVSTTTLIRMK